MVLWVGLVEFCPRLEEVRTACLRGRRTVLHVIERSWPRSAFGSMSHHLGWMRDCRTAVGCTRPALTCSILFVAKNTAASPSLTVAHLLPTNRMEPQHDAHGGVAVPTRYEHCRGDSYEPRRSSPSWSERR
jgi:hypothetical protein